MPASFATPWTVARQAPLAMGFPRQKYWSGWPFPSPGDLSFPWIEPKSPAWAGFFFFFLTTEPPGKTILSLPAWKLVLEWSSWPQVQDSCSVVREAIPSLRAGEWEATGMPGSLLRMKVTVWVAGPEGKRPGGPAHIAEQLPSLGTTAACIFLC